MDRNKIKIDRTIRDFIKKIRLKFRPIKIILFGSRAYCENWKYSDYDFIIVSGILRK